MLAHKLIRLLNKHGVWYRTMAFREDLIIFTRYRTFWCKPQGVA